MADGSGEADGFVQRVSGAFAREVFQPMVQRATSHPADVRQVIAECRQRLEALEFVIASCPMPPAHTQGLLESLPRAKEPLGVKDDGGPDEFDDIGRNQRSRLRELTLLECMSRETRPFSLQQLMNALMARGFDDTQAAVVSQLHRMKRSDYVKQPANGMYEITNLGLGHLRTLRQSFGPLMGG